PIMLEDRRPRDVGGSPMLPDPDEVGLSPDERFRAVATLLARGLARWRKRAHVSGMIPAGGCRKFPEDCLELPGKTRLSVVNGTRGLWPRDDGDDA
ncbi:MAG: hypothetical protein ACE5E8_11835, partial [Acidimicrobiia bacterium]